MKVYLCAGFGEPLPLSDIGVIHDLGFAGIRQDVPNAAVAPALAQDLMGTGLQALFVIRATYGDEDRTLATLKATAEAARGMVASYELGNEPDIAAGWRDHPRAFGELVAKAAAMVEQSLGGEQVVSGGISSLSRDALSWLGAAVPFIPETVAIGYHPYRSTPPGLPLKGYASRQDEFSGLRDHAGDRPIWMTEIGWHTAPRNRDFPLCFLRKGYSDGEVAAFLREELRINAAEGAEVSCVFQFNDGPSPAEGEDRFGIRRQDGWLKPSAAVAREWNA